LYEQITRNKWKSVLLVVVVLLVAVGLGYLFGLLFDFGVVGVVVALLIAAGMSFASYRYGDRIVLRASRARPASPEEYARLHNIVEGLCIAAGIPSRPCT
jgi:heat shock protein HtpX